MAVQSGVSNLDLRAHVWGYLRKRSYPDKDRVQDTEPVSTDRQIGCTNCSVTP